MIMAHSVHNFLAVWSPSPYVLRTRYVDALKDQGYGRGGRHSLGQRSVVDEDVVALGVHDANLPGGGARERGGERSR